MFDFGNANNAQRKAISTTDGPLLITAGPGTGKTYTLVQRAIYLIEQCDVKPESIFIATFTEKAAKELITRITNELLNRGITVNINEMYIGTFHSLCLRIVKDYLEYTPLKKNYRLLDQFDQAYTVQTYFREFSGIPHFDEAITVQGRWRQAQRICECANKLAEEMVTPEDLIKDRRADIKALGHIFRTYQNILETENLIDFAAIQTKAYELLTSEKRVLDEIRSKISHIMVDEYQDTNYIQEQIVFLLAGKKKNICVVGDDDQGLYRFRGATVRNILEFTDKFKKGECKVIRLERNYRSNSDIVRFYNEWMETTGGESFRFDWGKYRLPKTIKPHAKSKLKSPAVVKLSSENDIDEWHEKILKFIKQAERTGKLTDYNQIAFLFRSVKGEKARGLAQFLEENGINVYAPRSDLFFERKEIMLAMGCLLLMFPIYVQDMQNGKHTYLQDKHERYYEQCIRAVNELLQQEEHVELRKWMRSMGRKHASLTGNTDYTYSGLLYRLFRFEPFASILDTNVSAGVVDVRPIRNIAKFTQIVGKFEFLHQVYILSEKRIKGITEQLFTHYMRLLMDGGIDEYEDDSEYAPSGCVSFLTIHQSKGMEFPIVFVDSLSNNPRRESDPLIESIEEKYFHREAFEPYDQMKFYDFWRLYYTAFSRAQDLLVLSCDETSKTPSKYFRELYPELLPADGKDFDIREFDLHPVKDVNLKDTFSFTSHIAFYETCAVQYKFYKELEFAPVRAAAAVFGTLVHETIEDVHKAVLKGEPETITEENIRGWFESNYISLEKSEHSYLAEPQKLAALQQVLRYVDRQNGDWSAIRQAEVDVSLVKPDYIVEGKIDLIKGQGDTVEIVDFKSEKKPDVELFGDRLEHYKRQLQIYAHLVEERTGLKVSKMHIYYTGEEQGVPTVTFPYQEKAIKKTMDQFDETVQRIMVKDFRKRTEDANTCNNCDFRFYCNHR